MVKEVSKLSTVYMDIFSKQWHPKKDLGVVFSNDLKVRRQCEEAYSKASQIDAGAHQQNNTIQEPKILLPCYVDLLPVTGMGDNTYIYIKVV